MWAILKRSPSICHTIYIFSIHFCDESITLYCALRLFPPGPPTGTSYWIGLQRVHGVFVWLDGHTIDSTSAVWGGTSTAKEPNENSDCVISVDVGQNGYNHDVADTVCSKSFGVICELYWMTNWTTLSHADKQWIRTNTSWKYGCKMVTLLKFDYSSWIC